MYQRRQTVLNDMRQILRRERGMGNIWAIFEPNAFDGLDSIFRGQPGSETPDGRFAPFLIGSRLQTIADELLESFLNEVPKHQGRETISQPYVDIVNGVSVPMFSVSVPVFVRGEYVGVIGTDFFITDVNALIAGVDVIGDGKMISSQGLVAAHYDVERIGRVGEWGNRDVLGKLPEGRLFEGWFMHGPNQDYEVYKVYVPITLGEGNPPWFFALDISKADIYASAQKIVSKLVLYCFFGVLLISLASWFLMGGLMQNVINVTGILKTLGVGRLDQDIDHDESKDEIGEMKRALHIVVDDMKEMANFALDIGKGNLEGQYNPLSEEDALGNSLLEMRASLQTARTEQEARAKEEEQRSWSISGLAKFAEILRRDNTNMEALGYNIISNMVKYLGANQGGIFVMNDAENEDEKYLELKGCYAFDRKKFEEKKIKPGEGLVGTCYLEGETIYMTNVPDEYINITSGLGDANPKAILISPLKVNDEIYGVLELASFEKFEPYQLDFVAKASESIAATIKTVRVNLRTERLLVQSRIQAEELANHEEEMRQTMEEMQATQEESRRREAEIAQTLEDMKRMQEEMMKAKEHDDEVQFEMKQLTDGITSTYNIIHFSSEATITDINDNFLRLYGIKDKSFFVGKHVVEFIGEEAFKEACDDLFKGRIHRSTVQVELNGKMISFIQTYCPILDKKGQLKSVTLFAVVDTEAEIRQTMEAMRISKENQKMLTDAMGLALWDMTVEAGDPVNPGNVITFSDEFRYLLGYTDEKDFPNVLNSWADKLHPEDKERAISAFAAHMLDRTGKTPFNEEYRLQKKNGEWAWFHAWGSTMRDSLGVPIRVAGSIQDITASKKPA